MENVLPLFAGSADLGGVGLCFSERDIYCVRCVDGIEKDWLLNELSAVGDCVDRFAMFDLKTSLAYLKMQRREHCFDVLVAAYLLNPLNSGYTYEDVAREQLDIVIAEKEEQHVKICYEAYTVFAAADKLERKLSKSGMDRPALRKDYRA